MTSLGQAGGALTAAGALGGLVLDFDGVLSPIVDDPQASRMTASARLPLTRLVKELRLVAVLSGRPLRFLDERVDIDGVLLLGSYGVERRQDGVLRVHPDVASWMPVVSDAVSSLEERLSPLSGVRIEDKGVAVAAHWRQAEDRPEAEGAVVAATRAIAEESGLRLEPGKYVVELRAPVDVDKGTAVEEMTGLYGLQPVVYVGDDLGDVPAFAAARRLGGFSLLVEHGEETPLELRALCDESFDGVSGFVDWLERLASAFTR